MRGSNVIPMTVGETKLLLIPFIDKDSFIINNDDLHVITFVDTNERLIDLCNTPCWKYKA